MYIYTRWSDLVHLFFIPAGDRAASRRFLFFPLQITTVSAAVIFVLVMVNVDEFLEKEYSNIKGIVINMESCAHELFKLELASLQDNSTALTC